MRVATWNVNSIRARAPHVVEWAVHNDVDVALLQETKCTDADFPFAAFSAAGYDVAHHGVDHWNGVAIASRVGLSEVDRGFAGRQRPPFDEARMIAATCRGVRLWSLYVPNGRELDDPHYRFKLVWLERLRAELAAADATAGASIVAGDFNVAPTDLDIYDPTRWRRRTHASPEERSGIQHLVDLGLRDVTREHHPGPDVYTWWSYRPGQFEQNRGLRIDYALCSPSVADRVRSVTIDHDARASERPSDHAPVVLELVDHATRPD